MRPSSQAFTLLLAPAISALALSLACGGSSSGSPTATAPAAPATGATSIILTDAPSDQWNAIEVVVTKVTLLNKADHTKEVVAFQGTSSKINLVDLDSVGELLASAQLPAGTYDAVRITIDPASVNLVKSDGTTVPPSQVHVQGATVQVALSSDLVVTASGSNAVQIDFDLGHPLFLVQMPNGDWSLNLQARHRPIVGSLAQLAFRHRKGTIASVSATGFVLHTDAGNDLTVNVDTGAWFYDVDAKAVGSLAGLTAGKNALVKLRMQPDGSLWAVRVWYSASALQGWTPEGHVLSVDRAANRMLVTTNGSVPRVIAIDSDTAFTFHESQALGTGQSVLGDVWAGFKVQVEVKDPLQVPMHASSVNIQRAVDGGVIKTATATSFTYHHPWAGDRDHAYANPFTWWYLGFPGVTSTLPGDFASAVTGAGDVRVQGVSDLVWNSGSSAWDASTAVFLPVALPQGTISTSYSNGALGFTFTNSSAASQAITVNLNTTVGAQPAVVEVARQAGVVTVNPIDVSAWGTKLVSPAKARVAVVPKPDGTFSAYAVVVFTGF
ncbi:DUF4382 domain-containing protein [Geothrix sp. PMB-07]|uniref:DUF4382 domain-containing protein n=1 Tax=Geothrix sp. PMB-07 TaxID=3068640 RepID=UPI0027420D6C|nr:DUF4382 domain-containing protein [Geothrix sp. PMB-07]WLT31102.1 DUF4382 domain-containing protein [Geothrix sp. PMB-07]